MFYGNIIIVVYKFVLRLATLVVKARCIMENNKKLIIRPRRAALGKTAVVSVRLSEDMLKRLDAITDRTGHSRNELIQMCVEFGLDNLEIKED